ncbi:hypothetical protein GDO86_013697 [Hymenochirus boettgeri]|uniref:Triacylglycerol lipase n=1 Tax=Hymenochirus boettgeri TaxID=247094 RepID=A0A8T2IVY1_9PIPI|nr:hypothetical protein GDO86_013697 [Hymenochirus boettgeri]
MFEHLGLIFFLIGYGKGGNICYDNIGCFTDDAPYGGTFLRSLGLLPESPQQIQTRYLLFTRENPNDFQEVPALNPSTVKESNFKASRKSHFVIHGYTDSGTTIWLLKLCKAMIQVEDVNCFCVDWHHGAISLYPQSANNIRVVGAQIAYFIGFLNTSYGYSPSNIHLIGHSLGAHTAGEAGKRIHGLARITGLDPAGPEFRDTPPEVRLDPTDAVFVDVIHTDATVLGMRQISGHLDFYPNGGDHMAGCGVSVIFELFKEELTDASKDLAACNHLRSYKYYTESLLTPDGFIGYPSSSYEDFTNGVGFPCPSTGCPLMGHYADRYSGKKPSSQSFYLNTGAEKPFARWRYQVTVKTVGSMDILGSISVSLQGNKGNTKEHKIASGYIKPGGTYSSFIDVEADPGTLTAVTFVWTRSVIDFIPSTIGAKSISIKYGKDGKM